MFQVDYSTDGKIIDFLSGDLLVKTPEEQVRQKYLKILHYEYNYPKDKMRREVPIYHGSKEVLDDENRPIRADIVVYNSKIACANRDQGNINFIVECKAPNVKSGYNQLVSYIFNTSALGGVWFNDSTDGQSISYYRRVNNSLKEWTGIPRDKEKWDSLEIRKKDELLIPKDVKGLLKRCHNKLHGRGHEGEEEDLTMDMVRIILAKAQDEENEGNVPEFYCTPSEYESTEGNEIVAARIKKLFKQVKYLNADVFNEHETITVGAKSICSVVIELQNYRLLADIHSDQDWDIMGHAYEQYTATYLKRQKGQFFTNRLITDFLVKAIDPNYTDIVIDPAGGSGGFLTSTLRYVRRKILMSDGPKQAKERRLDKFRTRLFMVDMSPRLVKIAKTAMILNGDGHTGMTQGDSLGNYSQFDTKIIAQCSKGVPTIILTNPPFAGVGDGKISDKETLRLFDCGKKWIEQDGVFSPTLELATEGVPPELLFFERCVDWLAEGGQMGIILPKSFLDTQTYLSGRSILFSKCKLKAVINLHKNTFQPHTGVRTCMLILEKLKTEEVINDYEIFMAISKKIGQDSEGVPVFKRDGTGNVTDELDQDIDVILNAYKDFKIGKLEESEYCFKVKRSDIDSKLNINPQLYLPSLNETIKKIEMIDLVENWNVISFGDIDNIRIFKGPRLKSENLIVDSKLHDKVEKYYTPSAILQEKSDSAKWLDLSVATKNQQKTIDAIRVKKGDILITRSGSIGRVAYITAKYDNAILSDDMIRVRIDNDDVRYYCYYYLQTKYALDQMLRNEYGAVQQHLEPQHIRNIVIPFPDDIENIRELIDSVKNVINLREKLETEMEKCEQEINKELINLIKLSHN